MSSRILPIAASLAFLLGGCASLEQRLTEMKSTSSVTAPGHWSTAAPATGTHAMAPETLSRWWQQLGDEALDRLIEAALSNAPDIRTAQAALRQSRASRDLAAANLLPSLGASAGATRSRTGNAAS